MSSRRRGTALIVVLVVVVVLSLAAYGFLHVMQGEYRASRYEMDYEQARAAALSGAEAVTIWLERPIQEREGDESQSASLGQMSRPFRAIPLERTSESEMEGEAQGEGVSDWSFSVLASLPSLDSNGDRLASMAGEMSPEGMGSGKASAKTGFRFGLENESAKINLRLLQGWEAEYPGHARRVLEEILELDATTTEAILRALEIESWPDDSTENNESSSGLQADSIAASESEKRPGGDSQSTDALSSGDDLADDDREPHSENVESKFEPLSINRDPELEAKVLSLIGELSWWGGDLDRNFQVEAFEQSLASASNAGAPSAIGESLDRDRLGTGFSDSSASSGEGFSSGLAGNERSGDRGNGSRRLREFFTFDSAERLMRPDGGSPVFLNQDLAAELEANLAEIWTEEQVTFVLAYRAFGPTDSEEASDSQDEGAVVAEASSWSRPPDLELKHRIENPLDLVDAKVEIPDDANGGTSLVLSSPFRSDPAGRTEVVRALLEQVTVIDEPVVLGRISVNAAPAEVLRAVPGLEAEVVERIVESRARPGQDPAVRRSAGWIWSEGLVDLTTMKRVHRYLTAGGDVVSCQIVGFRDDVSPLYRMTATFDGTTRPARMARSATWHAWGRGFTAAQLRGQDTSPDSTSLLDRSP